MLAFSAVVPLVQERTWTRCKFANCLFCGKMAFRGACIRFVVCMWIVAYNHTSYPYAQYVKMDARLKKQHAKILPTQIIYLQPLSLCLRS